MERVWLEGLVVGAGVVGGVGGWSGCGWRGWWLEGLVVVGVELGRQHATKPPSDVSIHDTSGLLILPERAPVLACVFWQARSRAWVSANGEQTRKH